MKKSYLLLYSSRFGTTDEVRDWVDSVNIITDWRIQLPQCIFLISESSAEEIYDKLAEVSEKETGTMLIVEYSKNSQGRLNDKSWHLLEHKKRKPDSESSRM